MNIVIVVMILSSIGFLGIGTFILNNKYVKGNELKDDYSIKEVKAMKLSGRINVINGTVGIIISIICLIKGEWMKPLLILFAISIFVLSVTQYVLNKRIRG